MFKNFNIICNDQDSSLKLKEKIIEEFNNSKITFDPKSLNVIIIGGDGTFLKVFKKYHNTKAKLILINTGSIGFYQSLNLKDYKLVAKIFDDEKCFINPEVLVAYINNKNYIAINDVVITSYNVIQMNIYINDIFYQNFKGSGACLSSAMGSTAYNKSLHGAVIMPQLNVWQLTEIAPTMHNNFRSLGNSVVLSLKNDVAFEVTKNQQNCVIVIDGEIIDCKINKKIKICCQKSNVKIYFNQDLKNYIQKVKKVFLGENND